MKRLERALLLFFCLAGLLSVRAAAWGPPKVMDWEDFYALYQTAGSADSETHDLYLMGNVKLPGGVYELGPTDTAVRIIATEPYSFVAAEDATLILNNSNLTVYAENHSMGPFIISGGCLNLRAGTIQTVNCPAILLMSDGTHLLTAEGERFYIDATYDGVPAGGGVRAGILCGAIWNAPLRLRQVDLTVRGGDAAVYCGNDVELYDCNIRLEGEADAPAILFSAGNCVLTVDELSTVYPAGDAGPGPPEPQKEYILSGYYADPWTELVKEIECLSGVRPGSLPLAASTEVLYDMEDSYGSVADVPIHWDLSALPDPLTKGAYTVYGDFDGDVLAANHIVNARNIRAEVTVRVLEPVPYEELKVSVKPLGNGVYMVAYDHLPDLTGATAIYAEFRTEGGAWFRGKVATTGPAAEPPAYSENLLEGYLFDVGQPPFTVRLEIDKAFDTRLVIEGTAYAGATNIVKVGRGEESDGTDNGGDHGGGGQGSHDRYGKTETEKTPAPALEPVPEPAPETDSAGEPPAAGEKESPLPAAALQPEEPAKPSVQTIPISEAVSSMGRAIFAAAAPAPMPAAEPAPENRAEHEAHMEPTGATLTPQVAVAPASEAEEAPPARVPGFATATLATCAVILGGAAWFRRRKK